VERFTYDTRNRLVRVTFNWDANADGHLRTPAGEDRSPPGGLKITAK
jgi:hypothetical protein